MVAEGCASDSVNWDSRFMAREGGGVCKGGGRNFSCPGLLNKYINIF
jgi:hypothetical protein